MAGTGVCIAALGCIAATTTAMAPAHTIDLRRAADAVRAEAETLGVTGQTWCWRPVAGRRARHRALCVAWRVRTESHTSCALFYEVRSRRPGRPLVVIPTYRPWCATVPERSAAAHRGVRLRLAAAERAARAALGPLAVEAIRCFRPTPASHAAGGRKAFCLVAHPAPRPAAAD